MNSLEKDVVALVMKKLTESLFGKMWRRFVEDLVKKVDHMGEVVQLLKP